MRTTDALLRRTLLVIPFVLAAACGGGSGTPGDVHTPPDGGTTDGGSSVDPGPTFERTVGWSTRKRMRLASGTDVVLEEQLASFTVIDQGVSRIRRVDAPSTAPWNAPAGMFIEDAALHPSGAVTRGRHVVVHGLGRQVRPIDSGILLRRNEQPGAAAVKLLDFLALQSRKDHSSKRHRPSSHS